MNSSFPNRWSFSYLKLPLFSYCWSVRVAERLALPTSGHGVAGSNPAGGEILPVPKRRFIAQSLSCSPFHRLEMTEILLKGRKTLTHPSIQLPKTSIIQLLLTIWKRTVFCLKNNASFKGSSTCCVRYVPSDLKRTEKYGSLNGT